VITGLSGSGKSSLAFDTIYAEGQRRYVESLSAYARQFLDQLEKPDVDSIEGLSPAISIEQKTVSRSPRSTVGTVTEIYDYLRLLFSSIGQPHCHECGAPITRQSVEQIVSGILSLPEGERVMILAPVVRGRKGEFKKELEKFHRDGFVRARIDGEMRQLDEEIALDKRRNHTIEIVVDRLLIKEGVKDRLTESVRTALKLTSGAVLVSIIDGEEKLYSERMACVNCGINIAKLEPRSFSFNSAYGACKRCQGIGTVMEIDANKIVPDQSQKAGKMQFLGGVDKTSGNYLQSALNAIIEKATNGDKLEPPEDSILTKAKKRLMGKTNSGKSADDLLKRKFSELPEEIRQAFFHGTKRRLTFRQGSYKYESDWKGALRVMRERMENPPSERTRAALEEMVGPVPCPVCEGARLQPESLAVKVNGLGIAEYTMMPIDDSAARIADIQLAGREEKIAGLILREIRDRLSFLSAVGLGYLTLDRASATLSGGEGQRIRLATQIGSQLRGVLYVLDEPSIGLHPRDNKRLLETLHQLRDLGNTVLVVEHDEETIAHADYVVDLGPLAGTHGGEVVAVGSPADIAAAESSLTGRYLKGEESIEIPELRRLANGNRIKVVGARGHNLKNIDVEFPLGLFTVVTGVSGSGKSTLVEEILYPALYRHVYDSNTAPLEHDRIDGLELVDKIIEIDQSPIGRTPRSNPATYTGLFSPIRDLYAMLPESRARGYKAGRFSFNVKAADARRAKAAG
jgi:excinuclease ABC subunit A